LLALANIDTAVFNYLIPKAPIEPSRRKGHAERDFADSIQNRLFFKLSHDGLAIPLMLKPGMNEDTKNIGADKRSGPNHFSIFFQNQNFPVLMPLNDFRLRMEILKKLKDRTFKEH